MKLNPCPLCGGDPIIMHFIDTVEYRNIVIRCQNCGLKLDWVQNFATAPKRPFAPVDDGEIVRVPLDMSAEEAWNRRAGGEE